MTKNINTIHAYFGRSPDVTDGGDIDYDDPEVATEIEFASSSSKIFPTTDKNDNATEDSDSKNTLDVSKIETVTPEMTENSIEGVTPPDAIHVKISETEIKLKGENETKKSDESNAKQRKPKLSFRFPSRRPSKMASNKEPSVSPSELSTEPLNTHERKKSVMKTLFDNLPTIPPQHVSTATVNLKKKTDENDGSPAKSSTSATRRISFRLKSRRKSEAPRPTSPQNTETSPCESNENEVTANENVTSNTDTLNEVQKSKSFDDNVKLASALRDNEEDIVEANTLTPEDPSEQINSKKTSRKISRRESIAAAAASARLKWQQMKNATPSVHRMSLKKKREKRETNIPAVEEQNAIENKEIILEDRSDKQIENNNDISEDSKKESISKL